MHIRTSACNEKSTEDILRVFRHQKFSRGKIPSNKRLAAADIYISVNIFIR